MNNKAIRVLEYNKIVERLVALASSEPGKQFTATLMPVSDYDKIEHSLKETQDAVELILKKGNPPIAGIKDLNATFKRLELGGTLNASELLQVCDLLRGSRRLKAYISADKIEIDSTNSVKQAISSLQPNKKVEEKIEGIIISEDEIADDASTTLFSIRRQIRENQASIKDKLNQFIRSERYKKIMQDAVITMRGDRYVIPVKQEFKSLVPGMVHDMSASGATVFIEPMPVVEANNVIRQLKIKEQLEIERILAELSQIVSEISPDLKVNLEIMVQLDFVFAKAKLSLEFNCVSPVLNKNKYINIKQGRHPLLDKGAVVPIDIQLGEDFSTLVITGPNTGGKTVTLKTLGLFALMTQAGLHIPAKEGTEMCVFNNVYADIGDEQSIEQSLSTFSSHMKNIVNILSEADSESLVLFDELGAGTDPVEGAALATAILEKLKESDIRTVATTHYSELKIYAIATHGVENACCEFDVRTLKPTYKLLIGVAGKSNAFAISGKLGLPDMIIEKAKNYLTNENIKVEDILSDIERNRYFTEKEKLKAKSFRQEAERTQKQLKEQQDKLQAEKSKLMKEAKEEARKILLEAKQEAESMFDKIKELEEMRDQQEREREAQKIKESLKSKINNIENSLAEAILPRKGYAKPPKNLKPGDTVFVMSLEQKGTVLKKPDRDGQVNIQVGIMKVNVHLSNLRLINEQKAISEKAIQTRVTGIKTASVKLELDIRGLNVEEAIDKADKYIDECVIAGLSEVTLIHGKGTGVLRKGIHDFLKGHTHVKAYRLGKYGEGETGVTVVSLN